MEANFSKHGQLLGLSYLFVHSQLLWAIKLLFKLSKSFKLTMEIWINGKKAWSIHMLLNQD